MSNCNNSFRYQPTVSHERLNINTTLYDYYDPTNIIVDSISRDIAEYVKSKIINNSFEISEFEDYLSHIDINHLEIQMLMARLMFPTFFYDYIEQVSELDLNYINKMISLYETELKKINKLLNQKYGIEKIEWLVNKKRYYEI